MLDVGRRRCAVASMGLLLTLLYLHLPLLAASAPTGTVLRPLRPLSLGDIVSVRGGSYQHEPNSHAPMTLADIDSRTTIPYQQVSHQKFPSITKLFCAYLEELKRFSPAIYWGTLSSAFIFVLWQLPPSTGVPTALNNHFVCSSQNLRRRRFHTVITSSVSHASLQHLALNLYAFHSFGRSVKTALSVYGISLGSFICAAAVFSSGVFLLIDRVRGSRGSCFGLSGVTLACLAFDSLRYPTKELKLFVSFVPIVLQSYVVFVGLLAFSVAGALGLAGRSNVAHATHLGGLVFGYLFFEAFKKGWIGLFRHRLRGSWLARFEKR